ncbi:hypothetical protein NIES19_11140 [Anabaena cylindrica PCC 7122]|nr:hypothetical protein NIES19_11140 [Anabaena cylindrica PCC 7122]
MLFLIYTQNGLKCHSERSEESLRYFPALRYVWLTPQYDISSDFTRFQYIYLLILPFADVGGYLPTSINNSLSMIRSSLLKSRIRVVTSPISVNG